MNMIIGMIWHFHMYIGICGEYDSCPIRESTSGEFWSLSSALWEKSPEFEILNWAIPTWIP